MKFSANQAADETGKNISTITRAIKSGKLSADKKEDGSYSIDASELFRVYDAKDCATNKTQNNATLHNAPRDLQEMDILRELAEDRKAQIKQLENKLEKAEQRLDQERDEAKKERESARDEREKFMLWLEHKPAAEPQQQAQRHRWWQRKKADA
jgi:predicted  nucleic acid-binding Zn-ribbon protein